MRESVHLYVECCRVARGDYDLGHEADGSSARQRWRQLELKDVCTRLAQLVSDAAELEGAVNGGSVGYGEEYSAYGMTKQG